MTLCRGALKKTEIAQCGVWLMRLGGGIAKRDAWQMWLASHIAKRNVWQMLLSDIVVKRGVGRMRLAGIIAKRCVRQTWVAETIRVCANVLSREEQQARPTDWQKHNKQSQCHEATSHGANPEQHRPCRTQCSTACAPHFKTPCLANAAHGEHCKTTGLADAPCRRYAETLCYLSRLSMRSCRYLGGCVS